MIKKRFYYLILCYIILIINDNRRPICYNIGMQNLLLDNERLDDLQYNGLQIIQNPDYYCFTSDAVLLANYAKYKGRVCELGCGSGVISILAAAKNVITVKALEIQSCMADMARRSVLLNGMADRIEIVEGDIKNARSILGPEGFDTVLCNPPYMKERGGERNENPVSAIARHEVLIDLDGVCKSAAELLKYGGSFYMVHRADRLAEIICRLVAHGLEPKKITFYFAKRNVDRIIIKSVKGGKPGVVTEFIEEGKA